jgi:hypothetical protein
LARSSALTSSQRAGTEWRGCGRIADIEDRELCLAVYARFVRLKRFGCIARLAVPS